MSMTYLSQTTPKERISVFQSPVSDEAGAVSENTVSELGPASLDVRYEVAFRLGHAVAEVQAVFTQLEGRILRVWTVVPDRDEEVYKKLYVQERSLLDALDGIEFEFNIIPNFGRNPKEVITDPSGALVFAR